MTKRWLPAVRLKLLAKQDRTWGYLTDYVSSKMVRRFGFLTRMEAPAVTKVGLNVGIGNQRTDKSVVTEARLSLSKIAAQTPALTKTSKAIASFKVRKHETVGLRTTVRNRRMRELLDHLINLAIPRTRDFRGIKSRSFDSAGNITIGLIDYNIFPGVSDNKGEGRLGMNVSIATSAGNKTLAAFLLKTLNFPMKG